ncbi:MAG: zinc-ribbon domain-containing protein, partial [Candidatus Helarchaeota archaeon]|nr:zinc-ribbon domain-containing protein [Candidatus Helarchaeota archaeon]
NYTDGCLFQYLTYLTPGTYDYSFECNDSLYYNSTATVVGLVVSESNFFVPDLISAIVAPPTGDQYTEFNFTVIYRDTDDNQPIDVNVLINGTPYSMNKVNPSDVNYTDGCLFQYLTYLTPGTYDYSFECNDSIFYNSTATVVGLVVNESNFFTPNLISAAVIPPTGNQYTEFNFTVIYRDTDDNQPTYVNVIINGTPFLMNKVNPSDVNYTDGCLYQYLTYLTPGTYDYSFECNDSLYYNTTVTMGLGVIRVNLFTPNLIGANVTPTMGDQFTQFNFSVIYSDVDNDGPVSINVLINGTPYPMTKQNPADVNYTDGCLYQYVNLLSMDTPGFLNTSLSYEYSFECNDGLWSNSTVTYVGLTVNITNTNAPALLSGAVFPLTGDQYTEFTFSITYFDLDNNAPDFIRVLINGVPHPMVKLNPSDVNYTDGCIYMYQTTLSPGYYVIFFESDDGAFTNSTSIPLSCTVTETKGFLDEYWWILALVGIVGVALAVIVLSYSRAKKRRPTVGLEIIPPKDEVEIVAEEVKPPKPVPEKLQFACSSCTGEFSVDRLDASVRHCPNCGKPLDLIKSCPQCTELMTIPHEVYPKFVGKSLECPNCKAIFTLAGIEPLPSPPPEEEPVIPYLVIEPEQFSCSTCGTTLPIQKPDISMVYKCPICDQPLNRILKCSKCDYKAAFKQEDYPNYVDRNIECPKCKKKQEEEELSQIISRLRDEKRETRIQAAELLGEIGDKKAGPFLLEAVMTDQDNNVRAAAIFSLGMLGVITALPLLKRLMEEDPDPEVRKRAAEAVELIEKKKITHG